MKKRISSGLLVTLLVFSAVLAGPDLTGQVEKATAPPHPFDFSLAAHRSLEWRQPAGRGRAAGLYLLDRVPAGTITRFLVLSPGGRAVRITDTLDPRRGVHTKELLDDATAWWARLEEKFGVRADSIGAYMESDRWIWGKSAPERVRLRFEASGVSAVERELPLIDPTIPYANFAETLAESCADGEILAGLPAGLAEAVFFLDSSLGPTPAPSQTEMDNLGYSTRGVFEVLAHLLRAAPPKGLKADLYTTPWLMKVGAARKGTSTSDPAVLELVSRFESVENADPLSDHRAAEVFANQDPPER